MSLITGLNLPWFTFTCGRGEVAFRLDKLSGFIVERTTTGLTVFLQLEGTTSMEVPMDKEEYGVFLRALVLHQDTC